MAKGSFFGKAGAGRGGGGGGGKPAKEGGGARDWGAGRRGIGELEALQVGLKGKGRGGGKVAEEVGVARDWGAGLPRELLEAVARRVAPEDRFCFRLVCRGWAEAGGSREGGGRQAGGRAGAPRWAPDTDDRAGRRGKRSASGAGTELERGGMGAVHRALSLRWGSWTRGLGDAPSPPPICQSL